MSRRIASIVKEAEHAVAKSITDLESKNGYPSNDVRHLAENIQAVRRKITELGLDPDDTAAEELYRALLVKFEADSRRFEEHFNAAEHDFDRRAALAAELAVKYLEIPSQWVLKTKAAKQILRANPPKRLVKQLNYRSIESFLKRENTYEVFAAALVLESKAWHKSLQRQISHLDQTDFEMRPVKLLALNSVKWQALSDGGKFTVYDPVIGAAALLPNLALQSAPLLTLILLQMEEFTPELHLKPGQQLAGLSRMVSWWDDTDHLIAELADGQVALNLKDTAINSWLNNGFNDRISEQGRQNFWQVLVERYQNRPPAEALFDSGIKSHLNTIKLNVPQPAFEFAEELDG